MKIIKKFIDFSKLASTKFKYDCISFDSNTHTNAHKEFVFKGGRDKFPLVSEIFKQNNINNIGIIGWGSQASAQAKNLRSTLNYCGSNNFNFTVGLRHNSPSLIHAESQGFTTNSINNTIKDSDLTLLLISDGAQVQMYKEIIPLLKPGSTLGFSHGFLIKYWNQINYTPPDNINIIGVCPKGMGPSVSQLYHLGKSTEGAGINSSIAVEQDYTGNSLDVALAWAVGIGSPSIFTTTFEDECTSDLFGERGILLGALHGITEALFIKYLYENQYYKNENIKNTMSVYETAFRETANLFTGQLSKDISQNGLLHFYRKLETSIENKNFKYGYVNAYKLSKPIMQEIYDEVKSGNELDSVIVRTSKLNQNPLDLVSGNSPFWKTFDSVKSNQNKNENSNIILTANEGVQILRHKINTSFNVGVYLGVMMSQIDTLIENDHSFSEIVNESITEAVDSLNPYMFNKGVDFMIDNCSVTARIGARKWSPRFQQTLTNHLIYNRYNTHNLNKYLDSKKAVIGVDAGTVDLEYQIVDTDSGNIETKFSSEDNHIFSNFLNNPIHKAEEKLRIYKPTVSLFSE